MMQECDEWNLSCDEREHDVLTFNIWALFEDHNGDQMV